MNSNGLLLTCFPRYLQLEHNTQYNLIPRISQDYLQSGGKQGQASAGVHHSNTPQSQIQIAQQTGPDLYHLWAMPIDSPVQQTKT